MHPYVHSHQAKDYKPTQEHFKNFEQLKKEISNVGTLPYFDINEETTLQMDASKKGLGACLILKGKVVCFASYALTKTEQNCHNLEREKHLAQFGEWKSSITCHYSSNIKILILKFHSYIVNCKLVL